jgi:hypothetical protein
MRARLPAIPNGHDVQHYRFDYDPLETAYSRRASTSNNALLATLARTGHHRTPFAFEDRKGDNGNIQVEAQITLR